jgi:hypothetical protein
MKRTDIGHVWLQKVLKQEVYRCDGSANVPMAQDDTLGRARRPRSVHDAADIILGRWDRLSFLLLSELLQFRKGENLDIRAGLADLVECRLRGRVAVVDDMLESRALGNNCCKSAKEVCIGKDTDDLGFGDRMLEL